MLNKRTGPFALAIISSLLIMACGGKRSNDATEKAPVIAVTVATASNVAGGGISASGYIEANRSADVSTRIMGTITRIKVAVGDRVKKGQLLASINNTDYLARKAQTEASISEAEAHLKNAQKDYDRYRNLYSKQSATAKELDNITLQYDAARSHLETAIQARNEVNALMSYTNVIAPFDGVVTRKMAEPGDMANPGIPLFTIEQADRLQVSFAVGETDISQLRKGEKAEVEVKATGKKISCAIREISPSATYTGGQYQVRLDIPDGAAKDLYAGMYVNVFIPSAIPQNAVVGTGAVLVPASSLVHNDQLTGIYTISSQQTALLRWVRTGKDHGEYTEVLSGLSQGEQFILSSEGRLYNGAPVSPKKM